MPTSVEALLIIALVVSPGYVFTQLARRSIPHVDDPTDLRFLVTAITAGVALHSLAFPWSSRILRFHLDDRLYDHRWEVVGWVTVVVLTVPAALGALIGRIVLWSRVDWLLDKVGLGYIDRTPSAWNYVMGQRAGRYVRVHLKDGGIVGGVFADRSFGSTDPRRGDIYLQTAWQLDDKGNYLEPLPTSQGVWISHDVMAFVHFFEGADEAHDHQRS